MIIKVLKKNPVFIPEFNENKKQTLDQQLKVELEFPDVTEIGLYRQFIFTPGGGTQIAYNDKLLITKGVKKLINCQDEDQEYKNGAELSSSKNLLLEPLITELREELLRDTEERLMLGESKPLKSTLESMS
jgi:hypothetical protein